MSRESYEQSKQAWVEENFYKGMGDPDLHGHYPGDGGEATCVICQNNITSIKELQEELGKAKKNGE